MAIAAEALIDFRLNGAVRALLYVADNLKVQLESGSADTFGKVLFLSSMLEVLDAISSGKSEDKLSQRITAILEAVEKFEKTVREQATKDLDEVYRDLLAGAEAQMIEFGEELEALKAELKASSAYIVLESVPKVVPLSVNKWVTDVISLEDIAADLERRATERERSASVQEELENTRSAALERREEINELLKQSAPNESELRGELRRLDERLWGFNATIDDLIYTIAENDREVLQLIKYREATALLDKGLPDGMLGRTFEQIAAKRNKK